MLPVYKKDKNVLRGTDKRLTLRENRKQTLQTELCIAAHAFMAILRVDFLIYVKKN